MLTKNINHFKEVYMIVIDNIINDLNSIKEMSSDKVNCCHKIFEDIIDGAKIDEDIYHSAKAFTSIINNIINKKLNYINYIVDNQIELLTFLNTYDDKYLSNIENLLIEKTGNEVLIVNDLETPEFVLLPKNKSPLYTERPDIRLVFFVAYFSRNFVRVLHIGRDF